MQSGSASRREARNPTRSTRPRKEASGGAPRASHRRTRPLRVWRLRRRRRYEAFANLLKLSEISDDAVSVMVEQSETFGEFVAAAHIRLVHAPELREYVRGEMTAFMGCSDPFNAGAWTDDSKPRRGLLALRNDGALLRSGDAMEVLRDQYSEFREALLKEPFV